MALKLSVKIGDVTNLSDARYAAGMGVDYIGFNIDSTSKNCITPTKFKEIVNWVSGIGIIGEIGNLTLEDMFSEEEYPAYLTETTNLDHSKNVKEIIFRIDAKGSTITNIENLIKLNQGVLFYILEVTAEQIENNVSDFAELCATYPIYLSTDFRESLLEIVVSNVRPKGIEIKGGLENQPGSKDYDDIADVLEWLEEEG